MSSYSFAKLNCKRSSKQQNRLQISHPSHTRGKYESQTMGACDARSTSRLTLNINADVQETENKKKRTPTQFCILKIYVVLLSS